MSVKENFLEELKEVKQIDYASFFESITDNDINNILSKNKLSYKDFLMLLSPKAEIYLEKIAARANQLSLQHFGQTILLYTPMYLGNYCVNRCAYCSYNVVHSIHRKKLTMEEIEQEAIAISATGLRHILILTGESKKYTPIEYIIDAVKILKKYFDSIAIEVYPMTVEEYKQVVEAGVDSMTIYQEVYDEQIYDKVHISGPKKNYPFRIDAPERACKSGMRSVNVGALLGLGDWREEAFKTGLHANYLQDKYPEMEIAVSLPRIRPHVGSFEDVQEVTDKNLVQIMLALRIYLPFAGITVSTRECKEFRDNIIPLGVTKMSAGVTTAVGGHSSEDKGESQFEISDSRSVDEMKKAILVRGYQPIFKDWMDISEV